MPPSVNTHAKGWLVAAILLLFLSFFFYLYDKDRTDEEILSSLQETLQEDIQSCLSYYTSTDPIGPPPTDACQVCKLSYNTFGRLTSWTNSEFLPSSRSIDRLDDLPDNTVVTLQDNRSYFQIRKASLDSTLVFLVPLYIRYEVNNDFLPPYVFMGRYHEAYETASAADYLRQIIVKIGEEDRLAEIELKDQQGYPVLSISNIPLYPFRMQLRYATIISLLFALIFLAVAMRIYTLRHQEQRYWVDAGLFASILGIRGILYLVGFPGDYLESDLFSPTVLAFHSLAPSLGELTLNIFTLGALVFVGYLTFLRISNVFFRRIIHDHYVAYPAMLLTTAISAFLIYWYIAVFEAITINSQVDIEFSNIFKTNAFSYLILLDVGMLLLSIILIISGILRLNALYARRYYLSPLFILFQILSIVSCNVYLHQGKPWLSIIASVVMVVILVTLYRIPFRSLLRQDLINYLMLTLSVTILVSYSAIEGVNLNTQLRVTQIAERVLGSQAANTVFGFTKAISKMDVEIQEIQFQQKALPKMDDFRDWVVQKYLAPNFKEFDVSLYAYSQDSTLLVGYDEQQASFGLNSPIPLEQRGEVVSDGVSLYQIPNSENKYLDLYVGRFALKLSNDSVPETVFVMELKPSTRKTGGLSPLLLLDQEVSEDIKLINSFDYAIYRDGILYNKRGESSFPIQMEDFEDYKTKTNRIRGDYQEFLEPIGKNKLVVVRYPMQRTFDVLTTFSFIFYFYILASLLVIALPVWILRLLRDRPMIYSIPLRSKIRFGLLTISILPMIVIIVMLYPFVSQRYFADAKRGLIEEASRITQVLDRDFQSLIEDPFGRVTQMRKFRARVLNLENLIQNDINIYDEVGKRIASTQPLIAESGIYTDLMNEEALAVLQQGDRSDYIEEERVGTLTFLSAYKPIIGSNGKPRGYVNIPYLARQDQLEDQVLNFLAYLANIYLIVFLMLNVVAVIVSNTITKPLSMVQQRLAATSLGGKNEPIQYFSKDEIGDIVSAYNQMVGQLESSEEKLAQTQREVAWRQMARQVAHEIKNPLTPMRLSIQHLTRAWKSESPKLEKMFPRVMNTLIVQIDSLVRIANSFSEFAKMPDPVKTHIRVNEVLLEVVDLYSQSEEAIWLIDIPNEPFWTHADRDQLSRCFNNIIKNGLQAIEENGIMHVSMRILKDRARIEIKDNGKGMTEEVQKRVFEPSFSTKTSGMGLGLAIVKKIIENTGGRISFRSEMSVGTTFIIEIPSAQLEQDDYVESSAANEMA
ncbi:MAG: ATP-binding protein [Bacteroidota bacterium]